MKTGGDECNNNGTGFSFQECQPSESMWSGSPLRVVAGAMMGKATESAEHNANLNFFFASLEDTNQNKF